MPHFLFIIRNKVQMQIAVFVGENALMRCREETKNVTPFFDNAKGFLAFVCLFRIAHG